MPDKQPPPKPRHWRQIHKRKDPRLLYAEDLGPAGTKRNANFNENGVLEVSGVDGKSKKPMPFIGIKGSKKLGLNSTNCKTLETITGTADWERWRGWLTLVVVRVKYRDPKSGAQCETDAIRIAPQRPQPDPNDRPLPPPDPEPAVPDETDDDPHDLPEETLGPDEIAEIARREAEGKA
jgi:hypothetical protein